MEERTISVEVVKAASERVQLVGSGQEPDNGHNTQDMRKPVEENMRGGPRLEHLFALHIRVKGVDGGSFQKERCMFPMWRHQGG